MKYIVMVRKVGGMTREVPVLFPSELVHRHVADALLKLPGNPYGFENRVAAAGDVTLGIGTVECGGRSSTLNIGSRGEADERLIEMCEYGAGVKAQAAGDLVT